MNSTMVAPTLPQTTRQPPAVHAVPAPVVNSENPAVAAAEERRWLMVLGVPFILAAIFFALVIGTGWRFWMAPVLIFGPGLIIFGFIYLGLTSDTNSIE